MSRRPLRIVYSFPHAVGRAGIGTTAFNQLRGAIGQGLDVDLYCTTLERELPGLRSLVETMRVGGRRIPHRLVGVDRAYRLHDRRVAAALRRRDDDFDLVHAWPRASLATFGAAHAKGVPCLREVPNTHTAFAFEAVAREHARLGLPAASGHSHTYDREILADEEAEYRLADILLMPSEFARRTFADRGVPAEKLVLHRYGFDESHFRALPGEDAPEGDYARSSSDPASLGRDSITR